MSIVEKKKNGLISYFLSWVSVDVFSLHSHVPEGQTLGKVTGQHLGLELQLFGVPFLPLLMQQPVQQQPDSESNEMRAAVPGTARYQPATVHRQITSASFSWLLNSNLPTAKLWTLTSLPPIDENSVTLNSALITVTLRITGQYILDLVPLYPPSKSPYIYTKLLPTAVLNKIESYDILSITCYTVCVFVPQAQFSVIGHGVLQSFQDQSVLGMWQAAQVKTDHLQSKYIVICEPHTHTHTDMQAHTHLPGCGSGSSSRTVMDWREAPVETGRCSDNAEPDQRPVWTSCGSAACSWTVGNCRHIHIQSAIWEEEGRVCFYLAEYQHCKSMTMKIASFCSIFLGLENKSLLNCTAPYWKFLWCVHSSFESCGPFRKQKICRK